MVIFAGQAPQGTSDHFFKAKMGFPGLLHLVSELNRHSRFTRSASSSDSPTNLQLPAKTHVYKFYFLPRTIVDWNSLDIGVRGLNSLDSFRKVLVGCRSAATVTDFLSRGTPALTGFVP